MRDDILQATQVRILQIRKDLAMSSDGEVKTEDAIQALALKELATPIESSVLPGKMAEDMSPIMFDSTSSSFVTFRPLAPLHSKCYWGVNSLSLPLIYGSVTCLTVGSRGDVQPYIALCKGLLQDGHKCRVASHPEYKDWIEGHGIEFRAVGGDPAELMR